MNLHNQAFKKSAQLTPLADKLGRSCSLSDDDVEAFLALPHHFMTVEAGGYLIREGESAAHCCGMLSGFVYRHRMTRRGARQILAVHLRGDMVELNATLDYADHSVQALTRIELVHFAMSDIQELIEDHPAIGRAFHRETMVDVSVAREWIVNLGRRNARERIAHLFCELALRQEAAGLCVSPNFNWHMTQEQIADATGLTSVHVNRTVQRMRADGLISGGRSAVTVTDWPGLQAAGDFTSAYLHQA